ncbi:MAG: hypothetical protein MST10_08715 [Lentisphaeria bacterium]|nr:hypothetical protein [Lentisphaeria bacterium]
MPACAADEIFCNCDYGQFAFFNGKPYQKKNIVFKKNPIYQVAPPDAVNLKKMEFAYPDNYPDINEKHAIWSGADVAATFLHGHKSTTCEVGQTPGNYIFRQNKRMSISSFEFTVLTGGSLDYIFEYNRRGGSISDNTWSPPCAGVARIIRCILDNSQVETTEDATFSANWQPDYLLNGKSLKLPGFITSDQYSVPVAVKSGDTISIEVKEVVKSKHFGPFEPGSEKGSTRIIPSRQGAYWNIIFLPASY